MTALLAATLQQVRSADADPAAMARVADLLARAAGPASTSWEIEPTRLLVNGVPIPNGAPGVALIRAALTRHQIQKLVIPGHTDATRWSDLATTLESTGGLYPTAEQFARAVQAAVPGSELTVSARAISAVAADEAASITTTQHVPVRPFTEPEPGLVSQTADRAALSVRLEPLIKAGMAAAGRWDWDGLATVLLELHGLEERANDAERWILVQERHRVVSPDLLQRMVREMSTLSPGAPLARAVASLGGEAVEAILAALGDDPSRSAQHIYITALESIRHAEPALLEALSPSTPTNVLRDVIAVVGRRRLESAVPTLAALRRHTDERVRTAAFRALENIGTAEAIVALR